MQSGQVLAETVVSLTIIVLIMAFVIDFGIALTQRSHELSMLHEVETEMNLPAVALQARNSSNPADFVTTELTDRLREHGYTGTVTAYYYEPSCAEMGLDMNQTAQRAVYEHNRVFVYGVTIHSEARTVFGIAFGTEVMPTTVNDWQKVAMYSEDKRIYRPYETGTGYYTNPVNGNNGYKTVQPNQSASSQTLVRAAATEEAMPGVTKALADAVSLVRT